MNVYLMSTRRNFTAAPLRKCLAIELLVDTYLKDIHRQN